MLDLSTVPVSKINDLVAMITKSKTFSWKSAAKDVLSILDWATEQLGGQDPSPAPIGSDGEGDPDLEAVKALADGTVVPDDAIGGGILFSIAISALIRTALKLLANNI